jgi:hypothetical protein
MSAIPTFPNQQPPLRHHSKLGVASFVMAVSIPFLLILLLVLALVLGTSAKNSPGWYAVSVAMILALFAPLGHLIGVIFGIIAVARSQHKKLIPALGIALNAILGSTGAIILVVVFEQMLGSLGAFR